MSPPCESYLTENQLNSMEPFYTLAACVCRDCLLVQLQVYVAPEHIFSEYAYFSAFSDAWVEHARRYAETMTERLSLGPASYVIGPDDARVQRWAGSPSGSRRSPSRAHPPRRPAGVTDALISLVLGKKL